MNEAAGEPGAEVGPPGKATPDEGVIDMHERSWLPRHCSGDAGAFAELLAAYRGPVYRYLSRCGVDSAARDDLFQEIFLRIHRAATTYDPTRALRPWVFTIVVNCTRNHLRGRHVVSRNFFSAGDARLDSVPAAGPDAEGRAQDDQVVAWLETMIPTLPRMQREVLLLVAVEGLPQHTVAEVLSIPVNTVKTHLRRARLYLAKALAKWQGEQLP